MSALTSYHSPKVEVRDAGEKGLGLFARERIAPGEILVITGGRILTAEEHPHFENTHLPFQVDVDLHLAPIDPRVREGIFAVNHSCAPNAAIAGQSGLIAMRGIGEGEEITFDYAMTDSDSPRITPFSMDCLCGSPECRGKVTDRDWRQPELRLRYRGCFAPYLQARIDGRLEAP